jgi:hypothetical protein
MLAAKQAKRQREEAEALARRMSQPQQLVPNSPSPRTYSLYLCCTHLRSPDAFAGKKPRNDNFASSSSRLPARPAPPSFFDRPVQDRTLGGNDGKVELLSRPKESKFSSHDSALRSSFSVSFPSRLLVALTLPSPTQPKASPNDSPRRRPSKQRKRSANSKSRREAAASPAFLETAATPSSMANSALSLSSTRRNDGRRRRRPRWT